MTAFFSAFSSSKLEKYPKKRGWSEKCYTFPYIRIQVKEGDKYVDKKVEEMLGIVYDNFDVFKLIICKSKGSEYEKFVDKLIGIETENTMRFIGELSAAGIKINDVRADLSHMLATAMINGMFEVVDHDFTKDDAVKYVKDLQCFFNAGWDSLLGLS